MSIHLPGRKSHSHKFSLDALPTYMMSIFPIPDGIIQRLDKIKRDFLLKGIKESDNVQHLVKWKKGSLGKKQGRLAIRNLKLQSEALRLKWLWRYSQEPQAYWGKVIKAKYGEENKWVTKEVLTPYGVFEFLESLSASLNDLASRELSMLKALKKKEEGESPFGMEDLAYYVKRIKDQQFHINFGVIRQYFPIMLVLSGIFKICQDLFGLGFKEVENAVVWHPDVQLFSVSDLSSEELVGYFYLDLYSRVGKYAHTCVIALQNSSLNNGSRQIPVALLVSQFEKEVDGHPGLLQFSEVVNLFHEFGHVVCNFPLKPVQNLKTSLNSSCFSSRYNAFGELCYPVTCLPIK
ncbi:hypothetical protein T459_34875 [Capsicum annuum]|uniref:Peptidase M3A/M3B catalytic domain-containing protein n=1 Tax=Capsicum annuum TaxID=4072 RepID=A0A2G2XUV5_CAPAN|nr:hypothetical protein FXO37_32895 [Capsicum annuum]PHT61277.1 hypothetical protein T459_34875 [Capsicum annuum]